MPKAKNDEKRIYKDEDITIFCGALQYTLLWNKTKHTEYFVDLETLFREVMNKSILSHIKIKHVDEYKAIIKAVQNGLVRVHEIANGIPYRIVKEMPDVKLMNVEDWLKHDEVPII